MNFATIKRNYDRGLWSAQMVFQAARKGVITPAEFFTITQDALMTKQFVPVLLTEAEHETITGEAYQ